MPLIKSCANEEGHDSITHAIAATALDVAACAHQKLAALKFAHVLKREKNLATGRELVFLAQMYRMKNLLQACFQPPATKGKEEGKPQKVFGKFDKGKAASDLGDVVKRMTAQSRYGLYQNSEMLQLGARARIPIEDVTNFLLPSQNLEHPLLGDMLCKLQTKGAMLRTERERQIVGLKMPGPAIRSDGTLFLAERLVNKQYGGDIKQYVGALKMECLSASLPDIRKVVIDGIKIDEDLLVELLKCFDEVPHSRREPEDSPTASCNPTNSFSRTG